jgi:hypothetical protein
LSIGFAVHIDPQKSEWSFWNCRTNIYIYIYKVNYLCFETYQAL